MRIFPFYCIHIHPCNMPVREIFCEFFFNFFSAKIFFYPVYGTTCRAVNKFWISFAAIMTMQFVRIFMQRECYIAIVASWYKSAGAADEERRISPPVLK